MDKNEKKIFVAMDHSISESDDDNMEKPRVRGNVTRMFNPERGTYSRLKARNRNVVKGGKLSEMVNKMVMETTFSRAVETFKELKAKKRREMLEIKEKEERKQQQLQERPESKGKQVRKKSETPVAPASRKQSKVFRKSSYSSSRSDRAKKADLILINLVTRSPPEKPLENRQPKRKLGSETFSAKERETSASSSPSAKRVKLGNNNRGEIQAFRNVCSAISNECQEFVSRNETILGSVSKKANLTGRFSNDRPKWAVRTPEMLKIKEENSFHDKKERTKYRNKGGSRKISNTQPVIRR